MDPLATFKYQNLHDTDAIRLLELQPALGIVTKIECNIISTTLKACREDFVQHYTALSYVWGDASIREMILVDALELEITVSLATALRHMRDPTRSRLVWADAICINQSDIEEKGQQVARMGEIYQAAQHTIIFLGEATSESDDVMDLLREERTQRGYTNPMNWNPIPWSSIFGRSWFDRVWVFQELMLSRDPWIQCGSKRVRWHQLFRTAQRIRLPKSAPDFRASVVYMGKERERISEERWKLLLHCGHSENSGKQKKVSLETFEETCFDMLDTRRGLGVLDPRDMLYAHQSCLEIGFRVDDGVELLKVDYKKTCTEVYLDKAKYFLFASSGTICSRLKILSYADMHNTSQKFQYLPTWCPDWTTKQKPTGYERLRKASTESSRIVCCDLWHKICKEIGPGPMMCLTASSLLSCVGMRLGTIIKLSEVLTSKHSAVDDSYFWPQSPRSPQSTGNLVRQVERKISIRPKTNTNNENSFGKNYKRLYDRWESVLGPVLAGSDSIRNTVNSHIRYPELLSRITTECDSDFMRHHMERGLGMRPWDYATSALQHLYNLQGTGYMNWKVLFHRRFALLDCGYMALVPDSAREGDVLCRFVEDMTLCYLLRPRRNLSRT